MSVDVGDEKQVKKRQTKAELARMREGEELEAILKTKPGRDLIWRHLSYGRMWDAIVTDPLETFRQLGHRDVGMMILADVMEAYPEAYAIMRAEHPDENSS